VPASAPAGGVGGGGGLPVTGTNIWLIAGTGSALLLTGGVLFVLRRRRESVKFVA
jgi:LPXTG-motif cell wall-anchored protein